MIPRSAITALLPLIRPFRPCSVLGSDAAHHKQAKGDIGNEQYPWEAPMSRHKFKIGQLVYYREAFQYRIKNANEPHERMAKEHELFSAA